VRLNPTTVQNVVTYSTVIDVPNPDLKLKPGMTANVNIEIARRPNVLRIPNAALRFRPNRDTFVALNQPITPDIERALGGGRGGFGRGGQNAGGFGGQGRAGGAAGTATSGQQPAPSAQAPSTGSGQPNAAEARGGGDASGGRFGNMDPEERRKRMEERMAQMTTEEREQFMARMRERGFGPGGGQPNGGGQATGGAPQANAARGNQPQAAGARGAQAGDTGSKIANSKASTIDSLFGPLPTVETRQRAWLYVNKQLKPVMLRLGISDGTYTEILEPTELQPNTEVVTNVVTGLETTPRPGGQNNGNPLMGPQRGPGPGGGGGGRGGGR
jgi:hypothetical protein